MNGRITHEWKDEDSHEMELQFTDEPDTSHMTSEELQFYEHDLIWELFMDYPKVKDNIVDAFHSVGWDRETMLAAEDIPAMVQSLRCETNVEISDEVEEEITKAIEAYKRRHEGFL
jgi:hypothetical protein